MKTWLKISLGLLVWGGALGGGCSGAMTNQPVTTAAAIQAIQQAPDPSAVVAAYGSGLAIAANDPKLHEAYFIRMVEMGLPEMAFHQAQTLATLDPNNGLAWGVVAYVDARRGQMPEAVSAINLAGQFASSNKFVAHTAGEILAWYDIKADKGKLPDNARDGLTRIRGLLAKEPAFSEAYDTARKAYQTQSSAAEPAAPEAPAQTASATEAPSAPAAPPASPGAYAPQAVTGPSATLPPDQGAPVTYVAPPIEPIYSPVYYPAYYDWAPDYCYDWGPGWAAPSPWCWWYPCGFWGGCGFYPFGLTFAFGDFDDFHHGHGFEHGHGFDHGHGFGHHGDFGHGGNFGQHGSFAAGGGFANHNDPAAWHSGANGTTGFFGTPARPSASLGQWNHQGALGSSAVASAGTGTHWWNGGSHPATMGARVASSSAGSAFARSGARVPQGIWSSASATAARPGSSSRAPAATAPATHAWSGTVGGSRAVPAARPSYSAPAYRTPAYSAPRYAAPTARSFGSIHSFPSYGGGWARPAPSYSAPAAPSFGGRFSGGGFHSFGGGSGGGFSGGRSFSGGGFHGGGFGGGGFGDGHGGGFGGGGHR
jgi:hypothetical protein